MKKNTFRRLAPYMFMYKWTYGGLILTMLIGISMDLGIAWFLSRMTNVAVIKDNSQWVSLISYGAAIGLITAVNAYFDTRLKVKVSSGIRNRLRLDTLHHLLRIPETQNDRNHSGEFLSRMTSDNQMVGEACGNTLMTLIKNPLLAVCAFYYLFTIYWPLALICACIGPMTLVIGALYGKAIRENTNTLQERVAKATGYLQDILRASTVFKTFGLENKLFRNYEEHSRTLMDLELKNGRLNASLGAAAGSVGILSFMVAFILGSYFVSAGKMEIGSLIAFIQLMNYITWPFTGFAGLWASFQQALGATDRIFAVMDLPSEFDKLPEQGKAQPRFGILELDDVSFRYGDSLVLQGVSLTVRAGEHVAIVGPSGGGKSTLFKLLLGLYAPDTGRIRLDGKDVASMDLRDIRGYYSLVPQDTQLFSGTIQDNIAYGKPDATHEEIKAAAKYADAYEFISELPEGINAEVGERGTRLSGGQRQRIAIARAVLRNAPVLLLDEATAALDNESERLVQTALERLMKGRTTLVIAHRLSTIRNADRIVVIDGGRIIEEGSHDDLLNRKGLYHRLYLKQIYNESETVKEGEPTAV